MVAAASIATWAYFGIIERLNQIETNITMMEADLGQNTEFRIKWPRGEMVTASRFGTVYADRTSVESVG